MSLINQVLKDLDKRGANTNIGEATIRVVHAHGRRNSILLVVAGAVGMLGVGAAVWLIWQAQQHPPAPMVVAMPAPPVAIVQASQAVAAPVQILLPKIDSVSPGNLLASGAAQTISIHGANFKEGASVSLRKEDGHVYPRRPLISLAPEQIVLKANFGNKPNIWTVEVQNAEGESSGPYAFAVTVPAVAARSPRKEVRASALPTAANQPVASAKPMMPAAGGVSKQPTQASLQQQADNEFRRAYQLMRQGRNTEALAGYENALKLDPGHDLARQTMVSLLLEKRRNADAERVLQEGLQGNPQQANFAMLLARLQVERNAVPVALETLQHTLPYAGTQPDYLSFVAALLQRLNRHKEAIDDYQKALQLKPQNGVWLMGLGISLHAEQRNDDAREAFKRALDSNMLNAELQAYVKQQLKEL